MSASKPLSYFSPGSRLGSCTIQRLIGRSRHAEVYRAFHSGLNQDVALKLLYPALPKTPELRICFRDAVRAMMQLKHPNIIRVFEFDASNDQFYLVMELVEHTTLRDVISTHPTGLGRDDALRIFGQIASAAAYAHDQQHVHGNIKPENVLIGADDRPVLMDFAIPCLADAAAAAPDAVLGAPTYLAPEQIEQGLLSAQSDVYSLGILFYELVTGEVPFKGATREIVIRQHLTEPAPAPSQLEVDLDPHIEQVILKALDKNPLARYETARELLADLQHEELVKQYDTLVFDREADERVRKRRSEIMRFERSRLEDAAPHQDAPEAPSRLPVLIGLVLILAVIAVVLAVLLL